MPNVPISREEWLSQVRPAAPSPTLHEQVTADKTMLPFARDSLLRHVTQSPFAAEQISNRIRTLSRKGSGAERHHANRLVAHASIGAVLKQMSDPSLLQLLERQHQDVQKIQERFTTQMLPGFYNRFTSDLERSIADGRIPAYVRDRLESTKQQVHWQLLDYLGIDQSHVPSLTGTALVLEKWAGLNYFVIDAELQNRPLHPDMAYEVFAHELIHHLGGVDAYRNTDDPANISLLRYGLLRGKALGSYVAEWVVERLKLGIVRNDWEDNAVHSPDEFVSYLEGRRVLQFLPFDQLADYYLSDPHHGAAQAEQAVQAAFEQLGCTYQSFEYFTSIVDDVLTGELLAAQRSDLIALHSVAATKRILHTSKTEVARQYPESSSNRLPSRRGRKFRTFEKQVRAVCDMSPSYQTYFTGQGIMVIAHDNAPEKKLLIFFPAYHDTDSKSMQVPVVMVSRNGDQIEIKKDLFPDLSKLKQNHLKQDHRLPVLPAVDQELLHQSINLVAASQVSPSHLQFLTNILKEVTP